MKSIKDDCLSKLILFGDPSLRRALREYLIHYHAERNHQGKDNVLLFPTATKAMNRDDGSVICMERLGGLLNITIGKPHEYFDLTGNRVENSYSPRFQCTQLSVSLSRRLSVPAFPWRCRHRHWLVLSLKNRLSGHASIACLLR